MYPGTAAAAAAADSTTQAQNQSIPDFVRGYNYDESQTQNLFLTGTSKSHTSIGDSPFLNNHR
jgi:hypothetical protein